MRTAAARVKRDAERRREAARLLLVIASVTGYASAQLSDGLTPQQAREAAVETAGELESVAYTLRHLARLHPEERRELARQMVAAGMGKREIARRLGVSERTVWRYLGTP